MNVGILGFVKSLLSLNHNGRLLAGRGIIKIDQRLAVYLLLQDREILAGAPDIEGRTRGNRLVDYLPGGRRYRHDASSLLLRMKTGRFTTPPGQPCFGRWTRHPVQSAARAQQSAAQA